MAATLKSDPLFLDNIPWTESPFFEHLLAKSAYPEEIKSKIRFFSDHGYLIVNPAISGFDQIAERILSGLSEEQRKHGSRVQDAWRYLPEVRRLATYPTILEWLNILYQRTPIPFQTLNFCRGTEQATHSDLIHFSCAPARFMAGVWFALEDVDEYNGALHYYPGSQKLPVYDLHDIGLSGSSLKNRDAQYRQYEQFIRTLIEQKGLKKETIAIKKGSYLIWSANLLHGGDPIKDKARTRHSLVTHYYFDKCRYFNPLYSNPYLGEYAWKEIKDICTGRAIPHVYNGQTVSLPLKIRLRYMVENILRNNAAGREFFIKIKSFLTGS